MLVLDNPGVCDASEDRGLFLCAPYLRRACLKIKKFLEDHAGVKADFEEAHEEQVNEQPSGSRVNGCSEPCVCRLETQVAQDVNGDEDQKSQQHKTRQEERKPTESNDLQATLWFFGGARLADLISDGKNFV